MARLGRRSGWRIRAKDVAALSARKSARLAPLVTPPPSTGVRSPACARPSALPGEAHRKSVKIAAAPAPIPRRGCWSRGRQTIGARRARPTRRADAARRGITASPPRRSRIRFAPAGRTAPRRRRRGRRRGRRREGIALERLRDRLVAPLTLGQAVAQPREPDADEEAEDQRDDRVEERARSYGGGRSAGRPGHEHHRRG